MLKAVRNVIALVIGVIEVVLLFRVGLKFLGVPDTSGLIHLLYTWSDVLIRPFTLAFPTPSIQRRSTLEFATIFALFAYAFAGYILEQIIDLMSRTHKK